MIRAARDVHVIDASVIAAAFFREEFEPLASDVLTSGDCLLAPEIIVAEVGNVIGKRFRKGEINAEDADGLLADFFLIPLRITSIEELIRPALPIACENDQTVYDSLYVALAMKHSTTMITADNRFVNALAGGPYEKYVLWLGEMS